MSVRSGGERAGLWEYNDEMRDGPDPSSEGAVALN